MEIRDYLNVLWRRKWVILMTLFITVVTVTVGTLRSPTLPVYVATATVRVSPIPGAQLDYANYLYAERLRNTYAKLATSEPTLEQVKLQLGLEALPQVEQIEANVIENTELIELRVKDHDPAYVRKVANALAEALVAQNRLLSSANEVSVQTILGEELERVETELLAMQAEYDNLLAQTPPDLERIDTLAREIRLKERSQEMLLEQFEQARVAQTAGINTVSLVQPASVTTVLTQPRRVATIATAAIAGLLAGLMLAFLFENLDTRVYSADQMRTISEIPILGLVPALNSRHPPKTGTNVRRVIHPAYRLLQTSLASIVDRGTRTMLVTSVDSTTGNAQMVKKLATTMAEAGQSIIVMEVATQNEGLYQLGVTNEPELLSPVQQLTEVHENLLPTTEAKATLLQETGLPQVKLVAIRPQQDTPWTQSDLHQVRKLIQSLQDQVDVVLINTPGVLSAPEACLLSSAVDGVLLFIQLGQTTRESIQQALKQLSNVGAKLIGAILSDEKAIG